MDFNELPIEDLGEFLSEKYRVENEREWKNLCLGYTDDTGGMEDDIVMADTPSLFNPAAIALNITSNPNADDLLLEDDTVPINQGISFTPWNKTMTIPSNTRNREHVYDLRPPEPKYLQPIQCPNTVQQSPHTVQQSPHTVQQSPHTVQSPHTIQSPHTVQQSPHTSQQQTISMRSNHIKQERPYTTQTRNNNEMKIDAYTKNHVKSPTEVDKCRVLMSSALKVSMEEEKNNRKKSRERIRRAEVNSKLDELALLMGLPKRTKKNTILQEAVSFVKTSRKTTENLRYEKEQLQTEVKWLKNLIKNIELKNKSLGQPAEINSSIGPQTQKLGDLERQGDISEYTSLCVPIAPKEYFG